MSQAELDLLVTILTTVATGGAAGVVMSFLVENWPTFAALAPHAKRWSFLGISIALSFIGWALLAAIGSAEWSFVAALYYLFVGGFSAFSTGTLAHGESKRRRSS